MTNERKICQNESDWIRPIFKRTDGEEKLLKEQIVQRERRVQYRNTVIWELSLVQLS